MKVTEQVAQFAEPVVQAHGCTLWDVEYVREGGEWFLRLYIDKDGGVDISDCEAISRAVDPILDEKDPVPDSYNFEVCSAGLERQLKRPSDFEQFMGSSVSVKLFKPVGGAKEFVGNLTVVSYTHLRAHETVLDLVCRLLLVKKNERIEGDLYPVYTGLL